MHTAALPVRPRGLALLFHWPRVRSVLLISLALGLLFSFGWTSGLLSLLTRTTVLGLTAMLVFGLFEQWPARLPRWIERWVLQVGAVAVTMPIATAILYAVTTEPGAPPFYAVKERMDGFGLLAGVGTFFAPWVALAALVRQKEAIARHQAVAFSLEKSELERQAQGARLRLLQAQVAPHFLFNTLANVQALVDAGSPRASQVLRSLVAYLRAAVPRLDQPATTLGDELQLVRAYLELMHTRMPDRLTFEIHADEPALRLACPPMTLLTLVENAVRHGIDPSEEGGRIAIEVRQEGERCRIHVRDSGAGLAPEGSGLGTGLATLRERLELAFGGDARVTIAAQHPRGVSAALDFPAREPA